MPFGAWCALDGRGKVGYASNVDFAQAAEVCRTVAAGFVNKGGSEGDVAVLADIATYLDQRTKKNAVFQLAEAGGPDIDSKALRDPHAVALLFIHERVGADVWDGVAVGGSTAASLLGIGDFYLSPYRIYTPRRFNSRNRAASFAVREITYSEVAIVDGLPVTSVERTVFDLIVDREDDSLVADALRDACQRAMKFDFAKLRDLLATKYGEKKAAQIYDALLSDARVNVGKG